jgi:hypothetical protein
MKKFRAWTIAALVLLAAVFFLSMPYLARRGGMGAGIPGTPY